MEVSVKISSLLLRLLDESHILTREQWADVLRVETADIEGWVSGASLPSPIVIRGIVTVVSNDVRVPGEILEEFESQRDTLEVSPGLTLGKFMLQPLREAFEETLRFASSKIQEEVLTKATEHCWQLREQNSRHS